MLKDLFAFDADRHREDADWSAFPGLVDVLSLLDMALDRRESLTGDYDVTRTAILSLNYDVLIDIALASQGQGTVMDEAADWFQYPEIRGIDYGVEFKGAPPARGVGAGNELIPLYKLHGSFNWLCSTATGDLFYSGLNKSVVSDYFERPQRVEPTYGQGPESLAPVLITPTHLKDMRNYHLARIWRAAETALREARRVLFIGYSLPGDDLHIKYSLAGSGGLPGR